MTAGESGEYELSCVGMARMDRQLRAFTSHRANLIHVREIQQRVHALTVEIHRHGHDVHVAGALAIAQQRAFHPVRTRHHAELGGGDRAAPVIVGVQGDDQRVTIFNLITEPLDLICIDIRRAHFNRSGQVDDDRPIRGRRQHLVHRIADRYGEIHLRAGKALGTVLKHPLCFRARVCGLFNQARTIDGNIANAISIETENVFPLHRRGAVVKVHHGPLDTLERGKSFLYEIRSRLHQHLHGDVIRDAILLNQFPQKGEIVA